MNHRLLLLTAFMAVTLTGTVAHSLQAQEIFWTVPKDGGTPRDANCIERIGPREFRVRASFEEGGQSVLRHAVP
jgi:hypothetical protein